MSFCLYCHEKEDSKIRIPGYYWVEIKDVIICVYFDGIHWQIFTGNSFNRVHDDFWDIIHPGRVDTPDELYLKRKTSKP